MQLESVNVGDTVLITGIYGQPRVSKITRVTPTQIVVGGGSNTRFSRKTGRIIGGSRWSRTYVQVITPERAAEFEAQQARDYRASWLRSQFARHLNWNAVPLEKLDQVAEILGVK